MRLLDWTGGLWQRVPVPLCLLLLAVVDPLAAQEFSLDRPVTPAADASPAQAEPLLSQRSCREYWLLPDGSGDCEPWRAAASLTDKAPLRFAQADPEPLRREGATQFHRLLGGVPLASAADPSAAAVDTQQQPVAEARQPNRLLGRLIPVGAWAGVLANSLLGYSHRSFHTANEGWFGADTEDGGADKTSHFADFFIVSKEMAYLYQHKLGYSESEARWWGLGIAVTTGVLNEIGDGFTYHGFSWQDLAMDTFGAMSAAVISATHTQDLLGVRGSHLPPEQYAHDVYSGDLKLAGVGRRLGINIGPLRWLLLSVTYASKYYQDNPQTRQPQRQLGFEIGLNLEQILNDLGVTRDTWWGHALHLVGDNLRLPYTAFGMRVDLNRGQWYGPNNGNYP